MALTTLAKVLQQLDMTDDATASGGIVVSLKGATLTSCTFAVNAGQTTLTITPSIGSPTVLTLTAAGYDTFTEVVTAINAISGLEAELVSGVSGTLASTLLTASQSVTINSSSEADQLTYTNATGGTQSAFISQCILDVDRAAARYCGYISSSMTSGTQTELYDGTGAPWLSLASFPVTSITTVTIIDASGGETVLSSSYYRINLKTGVLYRLGSSLSGWDTGMSAAYSDSGYYQYPLTQRDWSAVWPEGFQNIEVVYVGGYSSVPDDLERAARQSVVDLYLNRRANRMVQDERYGGRSVSALTADELVRRNSDLWAPFRRVPL